MRKKYKLVYGVGVNDYKGKISVEGKFIKSYETWKNMLDRCYSEKHQDKCPTYIGCTVSEEWLSFSNFKKWFDEHYRWDLDELGLRPSLDKDLLSEDNKVYSAETCVFLPNKVNSFLANKQSNNTSGFTGVYWDKRASKWRAQINDFHTGKKKYLGLFTDIELANQSYIKAREIESLKVKDYLRELGYGDNIIDKIN